MEIGRAGKLSTYEKEYYTRKIIGLSITAFLLIIIISFLIITNYTSLIERKLFEHIADKYGYKLSYNNTYELLSSDNTNQGNYIQLSDEKNNIYILFRYDEDSVKLVEIADKVTNTSNLYAVSTKVKHSSKIKTEEDILYNINQEFNPLSTVSVSGDKSSVGGGYAILKIDTVMNQHRINYTSNLLNKIAEHSTPNDSDNNEYKLLKSNDTLKIENWFNYDNSINYQLGILKSIVETEASHKYSNDIVYNDCSGADSSVTIIDINDTEDNKQEDKNNEDKTVDESLKGFINNKEDILKKYKDTTYTTYTSLILSSQSKNTGLIGGNKNTSNNSTLSDGIIIGTCENSSESINKMTSTMNLLIVVSYLKRTILL